MRKEDSENKIHIVSGKSELRAIWMLLLARPAKTHLVSLLILHVLFQKKIHINTFIFYWKVTFKKL